MLDPRWSQIMQEVDRLYWVNQTHEGRINCIADYVVRELDKAATRSAAGPAAQGAKDSTAGGEGLLKQVVEFLRTHDTAFENGKMIVCERMSDGLTPGDLYAEAIAALQKSDSNNTDPNFSAATKAVSEKGESGK